MMDVNLVAHGMSELAKDTVKKIFKQRDSIASNIFK